MERSNPVQGNAFIYLNKDNVAFKFKSNSVTRQDPDDPDARTCCFHDKKGYRCVYSTKSKHKEYQLYSGWLGRCEIWFHSMVNNGEYKTLSEAMEQFPLEEF